MYYPLLQIKAAMSSDLSWHQLNSRQVVQVDLFQSLCGLGTQTDDATFDFLLSWPAADLPLTTNYESESC